MFLPLVNNEKDTGILYLNKKTMNIFNFKSDFSELTKPATKSPTKQDLNAIVEEIHQTFYTEVDRILAEAKIQNTFNDLPVEKIEMAQTLQALGFSQCRDVSEQKANEQEKMRRQFDNGEKKLTIEAVNHFSQKYPLYKFITEDSVKKICKKYNLVYGGVAFYKGSVPQKNLNEILNFKIDENDRPVLGEHINQYLWNRVIGENGQPDFTDELPCIQSPYVRGRNTTYLVEHKSIEIIKERERKYFESITNGEIQDGYTPNATLFSPAPLEITAPLTDFDTRGMELKDHQLTQAPAPDPVVLCPVWFKARKHYLIVTAWGLEANDELVMNPKHN